MKQSIGWTPKLVQDHSCEVCNQHVTDLAGGQGVLPPIDQAFIAESVAGHFQNCPCCRKPVAEHTIGYFARADEFCRKNAHMSVVVYEIFSESRNQDGYWDRGDYTRVCIGGKVHVYYAETSCNDRPTPTLSIKEVGPCDGTCFLLADHLFKMKPARGSNSY
jgi:hypothetical protein